MPGELEGTRLKPAVRIRQHVPSSLADTIAVEEPLQIVLEGEPLAVTMRTPGDDAKLAVGFLFAEGILNAIDEVASAFHCGKTSDEGYGNTLEVKSAPGVRWNAPRTAAAKRGTLTTSSCGVCGRQSIEDLLSSCERVDATARLDYSVMARAPGLLQPAQKIFARTGGVHAAAVLDERGEVLACYEDVGRHNAVDKAIGALVYQGQIVARGFASQRPVRPSPRPKLLVVSGRASFEIIQKAARASIPFIASVGAASSLAIELSERAGLCLAAFVREDGLNIYTHADKLEGVPGGGR